MTNTNRFSLTMEARDHECDIQGVVNNAHYQHYFEHARHRFLLNHKIDFAELAKQGINLMVAKIEIEYKSSLRAHDQFQITVEPEKLSRLKTCFLEKIYNKHRLLWRLLKQRLLLLARIINRFVIAL